MRRLLLLALTAGLLTPIPVSAFFGEKEGTKVWSTHKILDNRELEIYRTYDAFTEKASCSHEILDPFKRLEMGSGGAFVVDSDYHSEEVEIKYGNNKPKPFTNFLGLLSLEEYSKYRSVKLRFKGYNNYITTHTINTSEVKKFIKSYKACERSTSK